MYLLTRLFDSTVHPWTDLEYRSAVHGGVWLSVFHTLGTQSTMPTSDHLRVDGQADRYACPTKVGDVTVWQTVLVNPFTPDPEGLTFSPTGDRTSDLWDDAATPFQLSYCVYVQSTGYFDNNALANDLEWALLMADSCHQQLGACVATHTPFFGIACTIHVSWPY